MSSSSVNNDSGHSGDDHDDAVFTSHQDIKPSTQNDRCADDDNTSSSFQDNYTTDDNEGESRSIESEVNPFTSLLYHVPPQYRSLSNKQRRRKKKSKNLVDDSNQENSLPSPHTHTHTGHGLDENDVVALFNNVHNQNVRDKPVTGDGDDIDDSYCIASKFSRSLQKETTLALSPSSSGAQPLQPITKHNVNNQLLLSSHITKPSSQQLDTSCDVDVNNTKQPSPTTAQSFIERKSIELQCIQKKLVQVPRATVLEVSAMQQDYAYGEAAIICDENLNQMKGHYDEECPIHDILNFSTDQLAYIRRMRDKMPKEELAQYIMDAEMALRLKILLVVPEDMQNLLTFGTKLNPGHQCLTGQNYPALHELERQSQADREILNLCLADDGCVSLINLTLPLALLDMVYGEGKKVDDIPEFRTGILSKMGQFDISCAGYDNLDGTQSGNRRVVDALAKKMHKSMTRSDFYIIMQKCLGFRIELNHTIRPDLKMVISFSTAYVTKEDLYDERLKSQDVETKLALFLRVVTHTASIYSEGFRANYSPKQIKEMDSSFSKLLCPIVLPGYDGEIYPLLTDFGDKSKMSHRSYELVQKQRDENLTKARQVWAEILRKAKANEPLTKKEQKSVDKFNKHHTKTSDMWKRFNSGGYVTPQELSTIRKVTKGGEKGGATVKAAWDTAADARDDKQKKIVKAQQEGGEKGGATVKAAWDTAADARDDKQKAIVKAQQEGGEKGGATVKAAWDMYHDGEWREMSLEQQSIIIAQQEGLQHFLDEAMEIRSTIDTFKSNYDGDDQFDREHALEFFKEEGCNPSALSKVMFEVDCREAKIKYVSDSAAGRDMVKILTDIENEFGTNVFSWLKSGVGQSMAKVEFDRLSAENPKKSTNDIIDELRKMTTTVKGSKVKLFSDGTISHLKSHLKCGTKQSVASAEFNKLKKRGMSSKDSIAELKKSGKLSADDMRVETADKQGQAWAIHRKWKKIKSLEEICEMIRADKKLGDKFANMVHKRLASVENIISRETQGMRQQVAKAEKELENGKKVLIGTHNPVDCKGECLVIWDDEHHTRNYGSNRIGDIKIKQTCCGSCNTQDRDFTFKSAVTNSWETLIFDQVSNSNVVVLTSVAALTSWSKEKEGIIRQRHESEASATNEDATDDSTASSAAAAKQPHAKKEKATKSKSASSKKTQSKSKRKPSEEKEEKKKKKKLKKLDSSKDSKMAAPTKKKDRSEKAVPKKKSTKSKPIVGSSSKAASKLASKSSKSADNGSSNKKETKIDITADRRFFIVRKVHKNDLATVQFELDMLINEFREQLDRATIVKEFIDVYRNEWREDMFEGLRNWLQELATSDSDSDDY